MEHKDDNTMYFIGRICIPLVGNVRTLVMDEAHKSRYLIHPEADKMYHDLRNVYWWPGIKKNIAIYISKYVAKGIAACLDVSMTYHPQTDGQNVFDLRSVETEFPATVFNDNLTSNKAPSSEPTISSLNNNEIDFRISFDESDDKDYTVVFEKNSSSYKIISTNDLKTESKNDNEKVNKPFFLSLEPSVSCIDDLDFFKDFENEFLAIVYNDALMSKPDFSTEPTLCPQHIDEFGLKDEASLSKYDEEEQNVLYYNDLFHSNIIYPDDLKSDKAMMIIKSM
nr:putative reverse transcriptase domain-containing protein [Tanacetum cinerariifolium]